MIRRRRAHTIAIGVSLVSLVFGCAPDAPFKIIGPVQPDNLGDGWEVALPEDVGLDRDALNRIYADFVSEEQYYNAKSLIVVKNGTLVFEAYCRTPEDRDRYGHIQSATKSVTSLLFGIALSEGYVDSLDQTLFSIIPDKFPSDGLKRSITLRHLLTMTSGLAFDNDDFSLEIYADEPGDPARYILGKPLYASPAVQFYYRDCDPHLISFALQRRTGQTLERWASDRLFGPLGITDYHWGTDPAGTSMGAHGLHLKPRDLAKIGQLVLDHGRWHGQQIVDSTWIAVSTSDQVTTNHQQPPHIWNYGFYWWTVPRWQAFTAWGQGGNFVFVVPGRNMVIVMTSLPDTDDDVVGTQLDDFEALISPLLSD